MLLPPPSSEGSQNAWPASLGPLGGADWDQELPQHPPQDRSHPQIWQGIDIETKMHVRFLNMETIALCH